MQDSQEFQNSVVLAIRKMGIEPWKFILLLYAFIFRNATAFEDELECGDLHKAKKYDLTDCAFVTKYCDDDFYVVRTASVFFVFSPRIALLFKVVHLIHLNIFNIK